MAGATASKVISPDSERSLNSSKPKASKLANEALKR